MAYARDKFPLRAASLVALAWLAAVGNAMAEDAPAEKPLPITRIVMYTSGVGFFERAGAVEGDTTIELRFGKRDINDLLKSLVLEDLDGGQITTVSYTGQNPIGQTLETFSVDLRHGPSLADLLRQVRGERVRISGPKVVEGRILGVEEHKEMSDDETVLKWDMVTLVTADGLRSVRLDTAQEVRLLDDKLNAELDEALALITQARGTEKKTVTLRCNGNGKRKLRVGYIQETPVWKTSYRLLLRDDEKPFLQGWAIVENTTDHDWTDVKLNLVSGRPVSFMMDLYQPMFAVRPTVTLESFAWLRPQRHGQDLVDPAAAAAQASALGAGRDLAGRPARVPYGMGGMDGGRRGSGAGFGGGGIGGGGGNPFGGGNPYQTGGGLGGTNSINSGEDDERFARVQGTGQSVANAGEVGELFRYAITTPVTLARQQSAMLPIVNDSILGEKVWIYNTSTNGRHPLTAFRLKNVTKLHLMQGPISVFDAGEYAGDAQVADMAPGAERLVSYALDLDTDVTPTGGPAVKTQVILSAHNGVLKTAKRWERSTHYQLRNSGDRAKTILVEQSMDGAWELVEPKKPTEKTRSLYRFAVDVPAAGTAKLVVRETREDSSTEMFEKLTDERLALHLSEPFASPDLKTALTKLRDLRVAQGRAEQQTATTREELNDLVNEQKRVRDSMSALDQSSDLYTRYVQKLSEAEDTIESLRDRLSKLRQAEISATDALADYTATLTVN